MDGCRVKTLHPKNPWRHTRRRDIDAQVMQEHGIQAIDMVVVNLYPGSQQRVAKALAPLPGRHQKHRYRRPTRSHRQQEPTRRSHCWSMRGELQQHPR